MSTTFLLYFVVPAILGTVILLVGVLLMGVGLYRRRKAGGVEVEEWPSTGGKILAARLDQRESTRQDKAGTHVDIAYEPLVEYAYTVKGVEYRGDKVFPGESLYSSQSAAQEILDKHPLNTYVPVKYNPDDPSVSTLQKQPEGTDYFRVIGLALTIFGLVACCFTAFMAGIIWL